MKDPLAQVYGGPTSQSQPMMGKDQVQNNAGGYVFQVNKWNQFRRFLVLGTQGGTYYQRPAELSRENATVVQECITEDVFKVISILHEYSTQNRVPKQNALLFSLAMAFTSSKISSTRIEEQFNEIVRTSTHLFLFVGYVNQMRGWGRFLKRVVAKWYTERDNMSVLYQFAKYPSRGGWAHRDVLRLSHPTAKSTFDSIHSIRSQDLNALFRWVTHPDTESFTFQDEELRTRFYTYRAMAGLGTEQSHREEEVKVAIQLLQSEKSLTWEMVPSTLLGSKTLWEELYKNLPIGALIRNLGRLTSLGVIQPLSEAATYVQEKLTNQALLNKARVHPLQMLAAYKTYVQGHGFRGNLNWTPVNKVVDGLERGVDLAFGHLKPIEARVYIGIDTSGSMWWDTLQGIPGLTPATAAGTLAMIFARKAKDYEIVSFSSNDWRYGSLRISGVTSLPFTPMTSFHEADKILGENGGGGTDCSLPMQDALNRKLPVDAFIVLTDNETWHGVIHPMEALREYRQKMGIYAKLIVVGMTSTGFSIADPEDHLSLNVVGFDTAVPTLISDFVGGNQ